MTGASVAGNVSTVRFIGIYVHSELEFRADTNDDIAENGLPAIGINGNADNLLVGNAECSGIFGSHVDMTLGNDKAFGELNASLGSFDFDGGGACDITGFTNETLCAESYAVGLGNLDLACLADGPENGNTLDLAVTVLQSDLFLAEELVGLGKRTVKGKLVALAEQSFNMFLSEMHMACGYFNDKIHDIASMII